jgi:hypothetical protein
MPKFALERGGPKRLEVSWKLTLNHISVSLDGQPAGTVQDLLKKPDGESLTLPDGSVLHLRVRKTLLPMLLLNRNGLPVPGSPGDPHHQIQNASKLLWFICALNVMIGLASLVSPDSLLASLGGGGWAILDGAGFGVLAFFTGRRSRVAIALAIALYVVESLLVLGDTVAATGRANVGAIIVRVLFLMFLVRGWNGMKELAKGRAAPATHEPNPQPR